MTTLKEYRLKYEPSVPEYLIKSNWHIEEVQHHDLPDVDLQIEKDFPQSYQLPLINIVPNTIEITDAQNSTNPNRSFNVGVLFSGGPAPGGHNIITALYDTLISENSNSRLIGYQMGMSGLLDNNYKELSQRDIDAYRNIGGFDLLGTDRTKLNGLNDYKRVQTNLELLSIDALIIIGGDDSNTNAANLAEYLKQNNSNISVIGCPKTIDGDLKNEFIETPFGFDTATKVYSELIGNVHKDCNSNRKYWHFIKLMGRHASHITLECALKTHPNIALISEEITEYKLSIYDIINHICDIICERSEKGLDFGSVLVPEGIVEFIPCFKKLIGELNIFLVKHERDLRYIRLNEMINFVAANLNETNKKLFLSIPSRIALQMIAERDSFGNVQVSKIETDELLIAMIKDQLNDRKARGEYKGKIKTLTHFFGYEGRCSLPSNFDCNYCYALGVATAQLIQADRSGYMVTINHLHQDSQNWTASGVPFVRMMSYEQRLDIKEAVINKKLVDLSALPYRKYLSNKTKWMLSTEYNDPGPIQFFGPKDLCDDTTITLQLENKLNID